MQHCGLVSFLSGVLEVPRSVVPINAMVAAPLLVLMVQSKLDEAGLTPWLRRVIV